MDAYAAKYGNFTYTSDWAGFNVPGNVVQKFFRLFTGDLARKERRLHEAVLPMIERHGDRFYLIGAVKGQGGTIRHETAHGLYYLDDGYRQEMDAVTDGWRNAGKFRSVLLANGYASPMVKDETQAYMATSSKSHLAKSFKWKLAVPPEYGRIFRQFSRASR